MHGLIGDRLLKRFVGDIRRQPRFSLPRVLGSESDNCEATTDLSETAKEQVRTETPERSGEATNVSASENGAKPAVDETLESHLGGQHKR